MVIIIRTRQNRTLLRRLLPRPRRHAAGDGHPRQSAGQDEFPEVELIHGLDAERLKQAHMIVASPGIALATRS